MASAIMAEYCLVSIPSSFSKQLVGSSNPIEAIKKLPEPLRSSIVKITSHIREEILEPIYRSDNDEFLVYQYHDRITRFQELNFLITKLIKEASLVQEVLKYDYNLFADLEERVRNSSNLDIRTRDDILEIIHLLRGYESDLRDLVLHRREAFEKALTQIELKDFLRRIYGPYLVVTCAYLSLYPNLKLTYFYRYKVLTLIAKEGRILAEGLKGYANQIIDLMNRTNQLNPANAIFYEGNKQHFHFSDHARSYIKESELGDDAEYQIDQLLVKMHDYLESKGLRHEIGLDVFVDADDPEWRELMLIIKIAQDLKITFKEIEPKLYEMLDTNLPERISDKILIKPELLRG